MRLILQKIKNKAVLSVCITLGFLLLIAVCACLPMFERGAADTMLHASFVKYIEENNAYPVDFIREGTFSGSESFDTYANYMSDYETNWSKYLPKLSCLTRQNYLSLPEQSAKGSYGSKGKYLNITYLWDFEEHIEYVQKIEEARTDAFPCYISEQQMDTYGYVLGEELDFSQWKSTEGKTPLFYVAGIYRLKDLSDVYWSKNPEDLLTNLLTDQATFEELLTHWTENEITYRQATMFDYHDISAKNEADVLYYVEEFEKLDKCFSSNLTAILTSFEAQKKQILSILITLAIPMFGMILAFMYMVAGQLAQNEAGEISMLKSRGISRGGICLLYLKQMGLLAATGFLLGEISGVFITRLSAKTTDFLTFQNENLTYYRPTVWMLVFGVLAAIVGILFVLIPVYSASKISIVEQKKNYDHGKKPIWQKYFFDIALLLLSVYLLINYNRQSESMRADALMGKITDPLLFLNAVLFLLAFGLFVIRLVHYIVLLIFKLFERKMSPAYYASFLQIIRSFKAQSFISLFLVLTVSFGVFYANTARTLNKNKTERILYNDGADFILEENWQVEQHSVLTESGETAVVYAYKEPDYNRFEILRLEGLVESMTRVMELPGILAAKSSVKVENCMIQAISTKEFGETVDYTERLWEDGHWYKQLNSLAEDSSGAILSENLASALGVSVGDTIDLTKYDERSKSQKKSVRGQMHVRVCAIVKAWPGFSEYTYVDGELVEQYLAVVNYATAVQSLKQSPYEIWCKLAEDVRGEDITKCLDEAGINLAYTKEASKDILSMKQEPVMQITNGLFSLSFLVAILLCAIGFLIYWITSIQNRELLLGVYRAMGMSVSEINRMLINEHIFSTFLSVLAGGGAGVLASTLFVKLFAIVYLPEKHNLDLFISYEIWDMVKLFGVIGFAILVCLVVLGVIVKKLDITQALKIGED